MKNSKQAVIERQRQLLKYLDSHSSATIPELAARFNVSAATARRDIIALRKSGDLRCNNDLIGSKHTPILPNFDDERSDISGSCEKEDIAVCAASMIEYEDTVFINSSSTALRVIPNINVGIASILTNNGNALTVSRNPGISLILLGGEIGYTPPRQKSCKLSMTGNFTLDNIQKVFVNKCILGVSGISVDGGLTSMYSNEMEVNRSMISHSSGPVIVVADHRKIGIRHSFRFADISDISILITDSGSDSEELDRIRGAGIMVVIADSPGA